MLEIPYGATADYAVVAAKINLPPSFSQATGKAVGLNTILIAVTRHRMVEKKAASQAMPQALT